MVDSQGHPERDGLDHLFGDSGFDMLIGGHASPPLPPPAPRAHQPPPRAHQPAPRSHQPSQQPGAALPSRRDLRGGSRGGSKAAKPAARGRNGVRGSAAKSRPTPPPAFVKPLDSAYPVERVIVVRRAPAAKKKKRGSGFVTILAVIGLFGSVALPAYAFAPQVGGDATSAAASTAALGDDVALKVAEDATLAATVRGEFRATAADELRNQRRSSLMSENFAAYLASGAREMGDDYPWFSELSRNQGGGLSPLNYFYRECVDFVAWRLNRDAGTTSPPYRWVWSNLTPTGGNASGWRYAWTSKGWPTGTTPVVGAVAWFPYNHVAYVKAVNGDGTVLLEEYNWEGKHRYGQRTVPASSVTLYLYQPPR